MLKLLFTLFFLSLVAFSSYVIGYNNGEVYASESCPEVETKIEWKTLKVPIPCNETAEIPKCNCKNITNTKVVYANTTGYEFKAEVYEKLAYDARKGFHDDIINAKYEDCEDKLYETRDNLLTAIGLYKMSEADFELKIISLESLNKVFTKILNYCKDQKDDSFQDIKKEYNVSYNRYIRYCNFINAKPIELY